MLLYFSVCRLYVKTWININNFFTTQLERIVCRRCRLFKLLALVFFAKFLNFLIKKIYRRLNPCSSLFIDMVARFFLLNKKRDITLKVGRLSAILCCVRTMHTKFQHFFAIYKFYPDARNFHFNIFVFIIRKSIGFLFSIVLLYGRFWPFRWRYHFSQVL